MAAIVYLEVGQHPPEDGDVVRVMRDPLGRFHVSSRVGHRDSRAYAYRGIESTLPVALTNATAWADELGVPVVYVLALRAGETL